MSEDLYSEEALKKPETPIEITIEKTPNNSDTLIQFNELRDDSPSAVKNIEVKRDNNIQFSDTQIKT